MLPEILNVNRHEHPFAHLVDLHAHLDCPDLQHGYNVRVHRLVNPWRIRAIQQVLFVLFQYLFRDSSNARTLILAFVRQIVRE